MNFSEIIAGYSSISSKRSQNTGFITEFNGIHAKNYIQTQLDFGFRIPGTLAAQQCIEWVGQEMAQYGTLQWFNFTKSDLICRNLLVRQFPNNSKIIIFAAHFDSRAVAEKEINVSLQHTPILGANDGGSGVAMMLELASHLVELPLSNYTFWYFFFDAEDQGVSRGITGLTGFDWCEGSRYCAQLMDTFPDLFFHENQSITSIEAFLLFDMVGGENLEFIRESHSNPTLREKIFSIGQNLGYTSNFPTQSISYSIIDDHVAFANLGIPTVDLIIDFWNPTASWPFHHTLADNMEHISTTSLEITGRTILQFIYEWCYENDQKAPSNPYIILYWVGGGIIFTCIIVSVAYIIRSRQKKHLDRLGS